jgi:transketolase
MAKATRESFGEALASLGEKYKDVVVLDADLAKATKSELFLKKYPDRFFEMGIAEANMVGTGAGLALAGKIPFICSFGVFLTGRYDIIRMSIAYSQANVKIVGTHAGIGIGEDGNSQMGLEDIALMRVLPNMTVVQPADDIEARQAVEYAIQHKGPMYLRFSRQKLDDVNGADYKFQFGKGVTLKDGKDIAVFATGGLVGPALSAAKELEAEGLSVAVINIHTIKPLDEELVLQYARKTKKLMTMEDHSIIGGLGSAVAELLAEKHPTRLKRIGMNDKFGESGTPEALYRKYGFDKEGIKASILKYSKE